MSPVPDAVIVEHVSKTFRVRVQTSLKRALMERVRIGSGGSEIQETRALCDISFRVPHGQTVAIVGRNGSGKSTMTSLLARVYRPTSGSIQLLNLEGKRANVAPLLELGAGFHPDLTGIENIEIYASLLGMTSAQIQANFDSIVEFSELGDKVGSRLRNWNAGAILRLGFSVAIHTDPDILLVDEVLAVGDANFQAKCYARIEEMQARQKTIVFVTHDLRAAERVADRVLWINQGVLQMDGDVETVLAAYLAASRAQTPAPPRT